MATVGVVAVVLTLPVLGWWVDWGAQLLAASGAMGAVGYGEISWVARLVVAIGILVVWRSPRAGALAAAVAIPALYAISAVLFYAVIAPGAKPSREPTRREPLAAPWPARPTEAPVTT